MADASIKRGQTGSRSLKKAVDKAAALSSYAVAGLPAASSSTGKLVYCSNGAAARPTLPTATAPTGFASPWVLP